MGTVPTNIHTKIETQYTIPIHSQFWRRGDVTYEYTRGDLIFGISGYTYRDSNWGCIHTDIHVYIHLHIAKILL